jgi:hypothetical protein
VRLFLVQRSPVGVAIATDAEIEASYPQVPPESPLPMHAKAFEFVGLKDLFGLLGEARRQRRRPPVSTAASPVASHG